MTSGIFRVPGSFNTVNALFEHYVHQMDYAERNSGQVQKTVSCGLLPTHITPSVDDVASTFKKFLSGLPGGILGSIWLFDILRELGQHRPTIENPSLHQQQHLFAKLIALAIASLDTELRISIICAVFGLLGIIGSEGENRRSPDEGPYPSQSPKRMGFHALGVVFGPLLLGNLSDNIRLDPKEVSKVQRASGPRSSLQLSKAKDKTVRKHEDLIFQVEKARLAVQITEMLISSWSEIANQLRIIGALDRVEPSVVPQIIEASSKKRSRSSRAAEKLGQARSLDVMRDSLHVGKMRSQRTAFRSDELDVEWPQDFQQSSSANIKAELADLKSHKPNLLTTSSANELPLRRRKAENSPTRKRREVRGRGEGRKPESEIDASSAIGTRDNSQIPVIDHATTAEMSGNPGSTLLKDSSFRDSSFRDSSFILPSSGGPALVPHDILFAPRPIDTDVEKDGQGGGHVGRSESLLPRSDPGLVGLNSHEVARAELETCSKADGEVRVKLFGIRDPVEIYHDGLSESTAHHSHQLLSAQETMTDSATNINKPVSLARQQLPSYDSNLAYSSKSTAYLQPPAYHGISNHESSLFNGVDVHKEKGDISEGSNADSSPAKSTETGFRAPNKADPPPGLTSMFTGNANEISPEQEKSPITQYIEIQYSADHLDSPASSQEVKVRLPGNGPSKQNATLYAEIQRLQYLLDAKTEEVKQVRRRLDTLKSFNASKALDEQLRETQRELKGWKTRAEWAEKRLLMQSWESRKAKPQVDAERTETHIALSLSAHA